MTMQPWSAQPPAYQPPVADYQSRAVSRLAEWVQSADAAYNIAVRLVESSFVPAQLKGKPIEATAAILAGSEVGLSPMSALRAFDIIQGQAAPRAITLRAIVQSFGHEMVLVESTANRCRMKGRRRGSEEWQSVLWTIDRAKDLGVTGKDNWRKQPGAMLVARATGELARLVASDAILGIGYSSEELSDGAGPGDLEHVSDAPASSAPTRRMSRKPTPSAAVEEEPEPDAPPDADPDGEPSHPSPSQAATRRMFALFKEADFPTSGDQARQMRLDYCTRILGHPIATSTDLTADEVRQITEALVVDIEHHEQTGSEPDAGEV